MKRFLWLFLLFICLQSSGQYDYSSRCVEAHAHITSLRFDDAGILLEAERAENPENLIPVMLENYIDFLTIIVGEDEAVFDSLENLRPEWARQLKDGDKESPWYRTLNAQMNLQWAFARLRFGEYFTAAREIRKAYLLLEENQELYPGFLPDKVGLGILYALVGSIPDNYRWIANLFSMYGSVEQGRLELYEVLARAEAEGYPYLRNEALFFLSFLELNLQPDKNKAQDLLAYYRGDDSRNLMLVFAKARILMLTAHNDEAISLLLEYPKAEGYYPFYYLDFLTGLAKLNRLDDDANLFFLRFTTNFKGNAYVKEAYQKLAWYWLLQENVDKYHDYMTKVSLYGDDYTDGDKQATDEARSGEIPNPCLLKARLLFDGGYYNFADSVLNRYDCQMHSGRDEIEFPYRKGRIAHAMGEYDLAISWYDQAMELGREQAYYFAANAALQAGNILESQENFELAEIYFKKCLKMPTKEYKTSINQKARAGLNRLQDKRKAPN